MTDYFAVLQQPRRPSLNSETVRQKYRELARAAHPDQQSTARGANDFTAINEAHRVLTDPKLRLQHLLQLEGVPVPTIDQIPDDLTELFMEIAPVLKSADQTTLGAAITRIDKLRSEAINEVGALDREWEATAAGSVVLDNATIAGAGSGTAGPGYTAALLASLSAVSSRLAFLDRWLSLLQERQLQLTV